MNYKFLTPCDNSQDRKISIQMKHTWVKYQLLQLLLIYHPANIVDEMNHILDDQDDLLSQPISKIITFVNNK